MEKIFYNGTIGGISNGFDAMCIKNGRLNGCGYLNSLKTAHPNAVMIDLQQAFILPASVNTPVGEAAAPADLLVLNRNPFITDGNVISEIKIMQIYRDGERVY